MNAKKELFFHVNSVKQPVKFVQIEFGKRDDKKVFQGTLEEVLPNLDFDYDEGYGGQELYGNIWYTDGTWSTRREYDGSEWWEYCKCPTCPIS